MQPEETTVENDEPQAAGADTAIKTTAAPPTPTAQAIDETNPVKSMEIWEVGQAAYDALKELFKKPEDSPPDYPEWWDVMTVMTDELVVSIDNVSYAIPYSINEDNTIALADKSQWRKVKREWVESKRFDNTLVYATNDSEIKATAVSETVGVLEGYLVRFSDADDTDLEGDFFDADTDYGPHKHSIVYFDHGLDTTVGTKRLGDALESKSLGDLEVRPDVGIWVRAQLDLRDQYENAMFQLGKAKKLGWSSGTAKHLARKEPVKNSQGKTVYRIAAWPLGLDASLTAVPAEPGNAAVVGKAISLGQFQQAAKSRPNLKALLQESASALGATANDSTTDATAGKHTAAIQPTVPVKSRLGGANSRPTITMEEFDMTPEDVKKMLDDALAAQAKSMSDQFAAAVAPLQKAFDEVKSLPATNSVGTEVTDETEDKGETEGRKTFNAVYHTRFGDEDDATKHIMREIAGDNYNQFVWEQTGAFTKFIRRGENRLDSKERLLLDQQVFPPEAVKMMIKNGYEVRTIKDTMVAAQGDLGGFAVPPPMQASISARLPGLTAVRGSGANVISLMNGNSVPVPQYDGGDDSYVGNLRGQWGSETQAPAEQNGKLKEIDVGADVYTYKIEMSTTLIQDAANLVQMVENDIVFTLAMDEDQTFLIGDGAGKPLGWLPGGLNGLSLKEVISGSASVLTAAGVKKLKRGVASQYRQRGVFVGNSDTYSDIEGLTISGTGSDFAFPSLSDDGNLLRRPAAESEAMPDIAANSFPLLYVDMIGYWIVEKFGLTVARFQDSGTGINKVQLQVRKRVGGRPVELWRAAVQKVAAP